MKILDVINILRYRAPMETSLRAEWATLCKYSFTLLYPFHISYVLLSPMVGGKPPMVDLMGDGVGAGGVGGGWVIRVNA